MKKLLVLAALVTTMSVSVASAKEFNGDRWQWFYSNSDYTGKVDLNTLSYDPETDTAKAWAVWVRTAGVQELMSYDIYFEDNSMDVGRYYIYQNGSDTAYIQDTLNGQNHTAAPGSGDEALIASVKGLVGRDAKLADYKKQQAAEAQARAEEKAQLEKAQQEARIAQQKEAERKAKHERNRSIIRGIFGI
ncbi:hypothetical protein O3890_05095 [Veillonella nakazawae]|uniref:hypothetical protein n=1 Tax=Veillonella nakazawae TaxID=2682456 RepID=UPI00352D86AC